MVATDPTDVLSTLIQRESVLYAVDVNGCDKRELTDALPVSRSTVDRAIRELESVGLVTQSSSGYRRTLLGELLLSEYYQFKSQTTELLSAADVFADLPPETAVEPAMMNDATIITATQSTPHEPISALCSMLRKATDVRLLCPAVFPQLIDTFATATSGETDVQILLTEPVATELVSSFTDTLEALQAAGADLQLIESPPPHALVVANRPMGTTAGFLVVDDGGGRALVRNSGTGAVEWVRNRFEEWESEATSLSTATDEIESIHGSQ